MKSERARFNITRRRTASWDRVWRTEARTMSSRSCLIEESIVESQYAKLLNDRAGAHTGLVIGKFGVGSRDFVLALVPTPPDEPGDAPKHTKGDTTLDVDDEWMLEHAAHVSRMLPGGLFIVGTYAFCSDAAKEVATPALMKVSGDIARSSTPKTHAGTHDDTLVMHLSSDSRKVKVVRFKPGETRSIPAPVEHKTGNVISNLVRLDATYDVDLTTRGIEPGTSTQQACALALRHEVTRVLTSGGATVGGRMWANDATVSSVQSSVSNGDGSSGSADAALTAELLCAPRSTTPPGMHASTSGGGIVRIAGVVSARCYAYGRESIGRAVDDLRADVANSIQARFSVLVDAADDEVANDVTPVTAGHEPPHAPIRHHPFNRDGVHEDVTLALPRRAWAPWLGRDSAGVPACDYLDEGESANAVVERMAQVLGVSGIDPCVVDTECEAPGDTDGVARDIGMRGDGEAKGEAGDDGGGNGRWRKRFDWGSRPTSPASTGTTARPNTPADALIPGRALEKELAKRVAGMDAADVNKALWLTIGAGVVLLACFAQLALSGYF